MIEQEKTKHCVIPIRELPSKWEKLKNQRAETLKHFPEIKVGEEAIKLLENISTPLNLLASGLISKERYLQFLEDVENKKIRLAQSKIKLMEL